MQGGHWSSVVVAALVVVGTVTGLWAVTPAAGAATAPAAEFPSDSPAATPDRFGGAQVDPDTVLLRADVQADGTAAWTVEYRVLLDEQNTTDAFESVAAEISNDSTPFTDQFGDRMRRTARAAENETGREMAIRNVTVETTRQTIGQEYGIIRYRFQWSGFAVANDTTLRAGDALAGFFLDSETQLRIGWPEGYREVSVSPEPSDRRDRAVVWQGQLDFGSEGPRVVATNEPTSTPVTTVVTTAPAAGTDVPILLGVVMLAALALLALLVATRRGMLGGDEPTTGGRPDDGGTATSDAGASDGSVDGDGDEAAAGTADEGPPEELLSNEERVLKLLEERGGRIKQQEVASEFDWTDARTSQVVSALHENDEIEKFRLGRENVLSLPDEDDI